MNKNYFFLLGLLIFLLLNTYNSFAFLSGANYRKAINITTNTSVNNYELLINLTYESGMNADFSNVVITDHNDNIINSYNYYTSSGNYNLRYVKVNLTNTTIYAYWGGGISYTSTNIFDTKLKHFWDFEVNSQDVLKINNGTLSGGVLRTTCNSTRINSGCYYFDGADDYIALSEGWLNTSNGAVCLWVRFDFNNSYKTIFSEGRTGYSTYYMSLARDSSNKLVIDWSSPTATTWGTTNSFTETTQMHHVCFVKGASNYSISYDGVLQSGSFQTGSSYGWFSSVTGNTYSIGALIRSGNIFFKGWIDEVRVYSDYISSSEIQSIFVRSPTISFGSVESSSTPTPIIELISPTNGFFTNVFGMNNTIINLIINITTNSANLTSCYLNINNNSELLINLVTDGVYEYERNFGFGTYYWNVTCQDTNNNNFSSTTKNFIVNNIPTITSISYKLTQRNPIIINYSTIDYDSPTISCSLFLNNNNITTNTTNNNTLTQFYFNTNSLISHVNITCSDGYATTSNQTTNEIIINNALFTIRVLDEQNQSFLTNTSYGTFSNVGSNTLTSIIIPKKPIVLYSTWGDPCTYNLWEDGVLVKSGGWTGSNCSVIINYTLIPNKTYVLNRTNSNYLFQNLNVNNTLLEATSINYACPFTIQNTINLNNYSNSAVENYSHYKVDYANGFLINITDNNLNNLIVDLYNYNYTPNTTNFNHETIIINTPLWRTSLNIQNNSVGLLSIPYSLNIPNYYGQKFNITYQEPHSNGYLCYECDVKNDYLTFANYKYLRNITLNIKNNYYFDNIIYQITNYHSNNTIMFYDENTKNLLDLTASNPNTLILVCEENTTNHNITNQQYNLTISCNKPQLLFYQTYATTTYYRSLMPEASTTNPRILNFTMVNLNTTNAIVLTIVFFGLQQNDIIRIYDGTTLLTEQTPDLSGSISFIAIQYHSYTIQLVRSGTTRVLGTLIADYSGTKYVNINPFTFGSSSITINDYIKFTTERTNTYAKITYNDLLNQTNIAYCNFTDKNKNLQMESIVYNSNNITFTYNNNTNTTLIANCLINHNTFGIITKSFLFVGNTTEENPTALRMEWLDEGTKKWFALAIIITLVVLTAVFAKISLLLLSGSLLFFNYFGLLTIPTPILTIIIVFSMMYVLLKKERW